MNQHRATLTAATLARDRGGLYGPQSSSDGGK